MLKGVLPWAKPGENCPQDPTPSPKSAQNGRGGVRFFTAPKEQQDMSESVLTAIAVLMGFPISLTIVLCIILAFSSLGELLFGHTANLERQNLADTPAKNLAKNSESPLEVKE